MLLNGNRLAVAGYLMYMGLYNSYTRQRIKPTTSGTEFKDVTVNKIVISA